MSDHIPDIGKMVSDTPRTDANTYDTLAGAARCTPSIEYAYVPVTLSRELERELNRSNEMFRKLHIHALNLNDRIRLMKEAGDVMESDLKSLRSMINDMTGLGTRENSGTEKWNKANE